jgi:hypothetical protein
MSTATQTPVALAACAGCSKVVEALDKRSKPRLKPGCKRHRGQTWCGKCWSERYVLRAVEFPIVGPVPSPDEIEQYGGDSAAHKELWKELREATKRAWNMAREIANWFLDEFYMADVRRTPELTKLPAMPKVYLYPKARERFPDAPTGLLVALEHSVSGRYRHRRYDLLWLGKATLLEHRHPVPYPVAGANWRVKTINADPAKSQSGSPCVVCTIAGRQFTLRLRGGSEYRRQLAAYRQIESGDAVKGELVIYRRKARESDGRNGQVTNEPGRPQWRLMAKLMAWLPRKQYEQREEERFFNLRTDADAFLYGVLQDREDPWVVNADQVRDWVFQHQRWLQRQSEDQKHEKRKPARRRRRVKAEYETRASKFRNRLKTFVDQTAAAVANFAARNRVTRVQLDYAHRGYVPSFPWFNFSLQLSTKLDEVGIAYQPIGLAEKPAKDADLDVTAETETNGSGGAAS